MTGDTITAYIYYTFHYSDVIKDVMASQITSVTIVWRPIFQAQIKKNQSSASLAFVRGIHRWRADSSHKGPVTLNMFPFDDVIMFFFFCVLRIYHQHLDFRMFVLGIPMSFRRDLVSVTFLIYQLYSCWLVIYETQFSLPISISPSSYFLSLPLKWNTFNCANECFTCHYLRAVTYFFLSWILCLTQEMNNCP